MPLEAVYAEDDAEAAVDDAKEAAHEAFIARNRAGLSAEIRMCSAEVGRGVLALLEEDIALQSLAEQPVYRTLYVIDGGEFIEGLGGWPDESFARIVAEYDPSREGLVIFVGAPAGSRGCMHRMALSDEPPPDVAPIALSEGTPVH